MMGPLLLLLSASAFCQVHKPHLLAIEDDGAESQKNLEADVGDDVIIIDDDDENGSQGTSGTNRTLKNDSVQANNAMMIDPVEGLDKVEPSNPWKRLARAVHVRNIAATFVDTLVDGLKDQPQDGIGVPIQSDEEALEVRNKAPTSADTLVNGLKDQSQGPGIALKPDEEALEVFNIAATFADTLLNELLNQPEGGLVVLIKPDEETEALEWEDGDAEDSEEHTFAEYCAGHLDEPKKEEDTDELTIDITMDIYMEIPYVETSTDSQKISKQEEQGDDIFHPPEEPVKVPSLVQLDIGSSEEAQDSFSGESGNTADWIKITDENAQQMEQSGDPDFVIPLLRAFTHPEWYDRNEVEVNPLRPIPDSKSANILPTKTSDQQKSGVTRSFAKMLEVPSLGSSGTQNKVGGELGDADTIADENGSQGRNGYLEVLPADAMGRVKTSRNMSDDNKMNVFMDNNTKIKRMDKVEKINNNLVDGLTFESIKGELFHFKPSLKHLREVFEYADIDNQGMLDAVKLPLFYKLLDLMQRFVALDKFRDSKITINEVRNLEIQEINFVATDKFIEPLFDSADTENRKQLSFPKFINFMELLVIKHLFTSLGDGCKNTISLVDMLASANPLLSTSLTVDRIQEFFEIADMDNTNQLDERKLLSFVILTATDNMFVASDTNKDGKLSLSELRKAEFVLGIKLPESKMELLFYLTDIGETGLLDFVGFITFCNLLDVMKPFIKFDKEHNDMVSENNMLLYSEYFIGISIPGESYMLHKLFNHADIDNNGFLCFSEFVTFKSFTRIKTYFTKVDRNHNGLITHDEVKSSELFPSFLDSLLHISELMLEMLFNYADLDNKGHLDFTKFVRFMETVEIAKIFTKLDKDCNSVITYEEVKKKHIIFRFNFKPEELHVMFNDADIDGSKQLNLYKFGLFMDSLEVMKWFVKLTSFQSKTSPLSSVISVEDLQFASVLFGINYSDKELQYLVELAVGRCTYTGDILDKIDYTVFKTFASFIRKFKVFKKLDRRSVGILTINELRSADFELGLKIKSENLEMLFELADYEDDKQLDFVGFIEFMDLLDVMKKFLKVDVECDGRVTLGELKARKFIFGVSVSESRLAELFQRADHDTVGSLSFQQFKIFMEYFTELTKQDSASVQATIKVDIGSAKNYLYILKSMFLNWPVVILLLTSILMLCYVKSVFLMGGRAVSKEEVKYDIFEKTKDLKCLYDHETVPHIDV